MKKSISIVIALILLVNVFAISAFAAVPSGNAIALTLSAEDKSYAAGETVMVTLSVETISAVAGLSAGEIEIGYDSSIFEPVTSISGSPALLDYGCTYGTIIENNLDPVGSCVKNGPGEFYASDVSAYGWDAGFYIGVAENFQGITYIDCSAAPQTFLTFPLKIKAGVSDGTYTIGVNKYAFEDGGACYLVDADNAGIYGGGGSAFGVGDADTFACGTLTITVGQGGVTPPPAQDPITVENITTQVQWQDKDAGKMRVAFRGNIKNYTLNLVDGSDTEIADISEMGVVYSKSNTDPTVGGENCTPAPAWTIYDFTTGGYFFRAVVGNYQYDNTETLYANAYIIIDGQTIYASNAPIETTGAQAYAAGVANGMSAK